MLRVRRGVVVLSGENRFRAGAIAFCGAHFLQRKLRCLTNEARDPRKLAGGELSVAYRWRKRGAHGSAIKLEVQGQPELAKRRLRRTIHHRALLGICGSAGDGSCVEYRVYASCLESVDGSAGEV